MTFGQSQYTSDSSGWTSTLFIVGVGAVLGIAVVAVLAEADKCPRLRVSYNKALRARGLERELADSILEDAKLAECGWARRFPFAVKERA